MTPARTDPDPLGVNHHERHAHRGREDGPMIRRLLIAALALILGALWWLAVSFPTP